MYFSGLIKVCIALNKCILVESAIRPSLDQIMILKDMELSYLKENGKVIWRVCERKKKPVNYEGVGLNDLHAFKWSKIK